MFLNLNCTLKNSEWIVTKTINKCVSSNVVQDITLKIIMKLHYNKNFKLVFDLLLTCKVNVQYIMLWGKFQILWKNKFEKIDKSYK